MSVVLFLFKDLANANLQCLIVLGHLKLLGHGGKQTIRTP